MKRAVALLNIWQKKNDIYQNEVMLIYNKKCSVAPLTTHIKLKNVSKSLKKEIIKKKNNYS